MLNRVVLFTAFTIAVPFSEIYCDPTNIDFQTLLEQAQQQRVYEDREDKSIRNANDYREDENKYYGSLKSKEIVELIQKAVENKERQNNRYDDDSSVERKLKSANKYRYNTNKGRYFDRYRELTENKVNDDLVYAYQPNFKTRDKYKEDDERYKHSQYNQEALEQLLSENALDKKYQGPPRVKLVPNDLVPAPLELTNDRPEYRNNFEPYSKVYVILNPKAIEKSKNKEQLNNLLSKILSLTSTPYGYDQDDKKPRMFRYKGFSVVPELLARRARRARRRDTREMYGKDSIEEDFKPKRARENRGGGGVGAGGRTAIPYIRHRGDIYERDA